MRSLLLASAVLLALASCGPTRADRTRDAEIKGLVNGFSIACTMAPAFWYASTEEQAEAAAGPCLERYANLWMNPATRADATAIANASNICYVDREFQSALQAEDPQRAMDSFYACFDERRDLEFASELADGGGRGQSAYEYEAEQARKDRGLAMLGLGLQMMGPRQPSGMNCTTRRWGPDFHTSCR